MTPVRLIIVGLGARARTWLQVAGANADIEIVARGLNPDQGGAEIVHYQTASGGAVYSAGSITYPASILVDEVVSKITANVIKRFTTV